MRNRFVGVLAAAGMLVLVLAAPAAAAPNVSVIYDIDAVTSSGAGGASGVPITNIDGSFTVVYMSDDAGNILVGPGSRAVVTDFIVSGAVTLFSFSPFYWATGTVTTTMTSAPTGGDLALDGTVTSTPAPLAIFETVVDINCFFGCATLGLAAGNNLFVASESQIFPSISLDTGAVFDPALTHAFTTGLTVAAPFLIDWTLAGIQTTSTFLAANEASSLLLLVSGVSGLLLYGRRRSVS